MKHSKLFATTLLLAVGGVVPVVAQTDVTTQYLQNPSFEESYSRFLDINSDRGVEKPLGWSVEWYQNVKGQNGMTFDAESMTQDNVTWDAKNGKAYFVRAKWENSILYLRQTMKDLRPGKYTLSFSAAVHAAANTDGELTVSVAGQQQNIQGTSNVNGDWTDYTLDFDVADGSKYATIEIKGERKKNLFKFGIDEFKLTYDGSSYYETLLNKAQALYDDNKDWAQDADALQAALTSASGKTTIEDKNQAIFDLETAIAEFKAANTVDVTSKIVNPNFDSNINGWTCTGGDGNNYQRNSTVQVNFNGGFLEKKRNAWNGSYNQKNFDVSQQLTNLPKGEYTIKAAIIAVEQGDKETLGNNTYSGKKHGGPYYIDDEHGVWLYGQSGDNTSMAWANTENGAFTTGAGGEYKTTTIKVEDGNLTLGFKGIGSEAGGTSMGTYANWIACDNWTLSYFGFDPTTLVANLNTLKSEAEKLLSNSDYANVTGEERTNLTTAKDADPAQTKTELEKAIEALTSAISTFTSAKSSYDNYVTETSVADKLGLTYETPSSAAEATEKVKELNVAEFNAVENDYTTAIELGTWTTSGAEYFNDQHWSGTTHNYLNQIDDNGQGWNSSNWTMTCEQTLTLPAGEYVFKAAGRKSTDAYMNLVVKSGEDNIGVVSNFPNGSVGIGITTDGKASFDTNDKFARNDNTGYGWQWRFVPFTLTEETAITFHIEAGSTVLHNWASFGDYTVLAKPNTEASTVAYNQAVAAANQAIADYAYVTGSELTALNEAIAADKGTTIETIDAATEKVKAATQTLISAAPSYKTLEDAKALVETELPYAATAKFDALAAAKTATAESAADAIEKTNAITSARRAYVESNGRAEGVEGAENCTDKLAATKCGEDMSGLSYSEVRVNRGEGATDSEGNKTATYFDASGKFWGSNNRTAHLTQEATGLASGKYLLTVQARGSSNLKSLTLTAGNASLNLDVQNPSNIFGAGWDDYSLVAEVGNTGSLNIKVEGATNANQAWFSFNDFRLYRIGDLDDVSLDETTTNTITAGVANVALTRTIGASKWNTLVLPFDLSNDEVKAAFGDDAQVAAFANAEGDNVDFSTTEEGIKANVPVLLQTSTPSADNTYSFAGVTLKEGTPESKGANYSFVGTYDEKYNLAEDEYILSNNYWWKNEADDNYNVKAFRAYLKANEGTEAAKGFNLVIDGQTTGLKLNTVTGDVEGESYNLAGQRVADSFKGIVVKNGKKVIRK